MELSNMEILQYAVSNGMIDTESLQKSIEMKKKRRVSKETSIRNQQRQRRILENLFAG